MDISPLKSIGFKLQTDETERLKAILSTLNVNYSEHTSRETFVSLIEAVEKLITQLSLDNQSDNTELIEELRILTENNEELTSLNSTLTKNNKDLTNELRILSENNQELNTLNSGLTEHIQELSKETKILSERNQALFLEQEILSQDVEKLAKQEPKTKVIEKAFPIQLGQYQLLIDLNYFQLSLLAKVANHFAVESLFNKQAQINPAAFIRIEGQPKERLAQTLINTFMGVQFNYHRGNTYLPENVLASEFIRKKGKEYQAQIAE